VTRVWFHPPWRTLALAAVALAVAAAPGTLSLLQYHRDAILGGEIWRILTAHVVHASANHLLWDVSALVIIGVLFEQALRRRFWIVLLVSMVTVGGGLLVVEPDLGAYCGLSGVLNGLWVAGALAAARIEERAGHRGLARLYRFALLVLAAKIAFEAATGTAVFTDAESLGAFPVPLAHLFGALGGWIAWRLTSTSAADHSRRRQRGPMQTPPRQDPRSVCLRSRRGPVPQPRGR
jgi:rhomboid family GlyGly-CTERM serine protease